MYKLLQSAALIVLVAFATTTLANAANTETQLMLVQGIGLTLILLLAGEALHTLWRN
jgi:hypothetical protein